MPEFSTGHQQLNPPRKVSGLFYVPRPTMTPFDIPAYTIAAVGCLYAAYRFVMWMAD
jgi:hypothetical protein